MANEDRGDPWLVFVVVVVTIVLSRQVFDVVDLGLSRLVESLLAGLLAGLLTVLLIRYRRSRR